MHPGPKQASPISWQPGLPVLGTLGRCKAWASFGPFFFAVQDLAVHCKYILSFAPTCQLERDALHACTFDALVRCLPWDLTLPLLEACFLLCRPGFLSESNLFSALHVVYWPYQQVLKAQARKPHPLFACNLLCNLNSTMSVTNSTISNRSDLQLHWTSGTKSTSFPQRSCRPLWCMSAHLAMFICDVPVTSCLSHFFK